MDSCEWCGASLRWGDVNESACLADPETGEGPLTVCGECAELDRALQARRVMKEGSK